MGTIGTGITDISRTEETESDRLDKTVMKIYRIKKPTHTVLQK